MNMVETLESHGDELTKRKLEKQRLRELEKKGNAAIITSKTAEDEKWMPILVESYF
jgi:hypothetical protein